MLALSSEALPNLFPSISHGFLSVHAACSSPQAISMVSFPSTLQSHPVSFPPDGAVPYFYGFLLPRCMLAPSQCSPKLYFHGFLSVHATCSRPFPWSSPQAISDSFLSVEVSPSYFPRTVSCPQATSYFCPSTLRARSLPTKLSASSLHAHALPKLFPTVSSIGPRCILAPLAPSQRTSVSCPSIMRCLRSYFPRFLPTELSPRYFHGFLLFRTVPPSKALPKPFRTVPCPSILTAKQAKREPSIVDAFGKKKPLKGHGTL